MQVLNVTISRLQERVGVLSWGGVVYPGVGGLAAAGDGTLAEGGAAALCGGTLADGGEPHA